MTESAAINGSSYTPMPAGTMTAARQVVTETVWTHAYSRDKTAAGRAEYVASAVVLALRREGLLTGSRVADSDEILDKYASKFGDAPIRGISHLVAQALVLLNLPAVQRDTLRALMPEDGTRAAKKTVGMQFNRALRKFHLWKWIDRGEDGTVTVIDGESLATWFAMAKDPTERRGVATLDIAAAVARLNRAAEDLDEGRRRELLALQRLMQDAPGAVTNARGHVRVVPKSSPL